MSVLLRILIFLFILLLIFLFILLLILFLILIFISILLLFLSFCCTIAHGDLDHFFVSRNVTFAHTWRVIFVR